MDKIDRRDLLKTSVAASAALIAAGSTSTALAQSTSMVKPARLKEGDTAMIVAPAGVEYNKLRLKLSIESLEALGLNVRVAEHTMDRFGYFPAEDEVRAAEVNAAFADNEIKAVIALKGGWGAARTLPFLDYDLIAKNPKILLGYSDITALLNAINLKTGLMTFHGPTAGSAWSSFSAQNVREILFDGAAQHMENPQDKGDFLTVRKNRTETIVSGTAEGRLVGGNLSVLTAVQGTPYFPDIKDKILMIEEIGENIYRVDRMLTQLALGGHLKDCAGILFGGMTNVDSDGGFGDFSLMDILEQHCKPTAKPAFTGAMFGHIPDKRTMAVGCRVKMNADKGTVTMLESAVS
jgi:muramoyltetrapeptide carboxypeptidase